MDSDQDAQGVELSSPKKPPSLRSGVLGHVAVSQFAELPVDVAGSFRAYQQEVDVNPAEGYTEHQMTMQEVARLYQATIDVTNVQESKGLSERAAKERLQREGPNLLTPPTRTPKWLKFARQFKNLFMILLLAAGTDTMDRRITE